MTDKTDREIMQQALDAMMDSMRVSGGISDKMFESVNAISERLAQPDPLQRLTDVQQEIEAALAPEQGQLEWQGAFFDAVYEAWHSAGMDVLGGDWNTFASTLEAKLKEKND